MAQALAVQVILLTDNAEDDAWDGMALSDVELNVFEIESYGWPQATLLRFELMLHFFSHVTGDIVMYLDADTEVVTPILARDLSGAINLDGEEKIVFVRHPGYFNRSVLFRIAIRTPLGPWERRKNSSAFVPLSQRKSYVCGGVFWGPRALFQRLCSDLSKNVKTDLNQDLIAKHNDESHINYWFSQYSANAVNPEWAYALGYRNLKKLKPKILVIHKPATFERVGTES